MALAKISLVALLTATALAGCMSDPYSDSTLEPDEVGIVEDPNDYSYLQNGTGKAHVHDYWGGRDVLEVMDLTQRGQWMLHGSSNGYAPTPFTPPAGSIIPLGTQYVHVTVDWNDEPPTGWRVGDEPLELWIKTAADDYGAYVTDLSPGETVTFESSNAQNDIPHQVLSAWQFIVAVPDAIERPTGGHTGSHAMEVHMLVEAERGLEIPPSPPHPDHWGNETELLLLEAGWGYSWVYNGQSRGCFYCGSPPREIRPDDGLIVPHDTQMVKAVVRNEHDTPDGLRLVYHGADQWEYKDAPLEEDAAGRQVYLIPVEKDADSPYATQSLWRFGFRIEGDESRPVSLSDGSFDLVVTVHDTMA